MLPFPPTWLYYTVLPPTPTHSYPFSSTPSHSQPLPLNFNYSHSFTVHSHQLWLILNPHPPTYTHFLGVLRVYRLYTLTCLTYLINLRVHVLNVCTSIYNARFTKLSVLTIDAFNVSKWNQRLFLRACHL